MTALTAVLLTPVGPAAIWWSPLDGLVCSSPLSSLDHWSTISLSSHNWLFSAPKSGNLEMEEPVKDLAVKISFKDPEKYKYGKLLAEKKRFSQTDCLGFFYVCILHLISSWQCDKEDLNFLQFRWSMFTGGWPAPGLFIKSVSARRGGWTGDWCQGGGSHARVELSLQL